MPIDYNAVRQVITQIQHCVIATASREGVPWLSTVFFNYTPAYDLIWESTVDARHSQLIADNPRVAVYIGRRDQITGALYAVADASQMPDAELPEALETWLHGPHERNDPPRTPADYGAESPLRLYRARLTELYVLSHAEVGGYTVEQREAVDLRLLRG